MSKTVEREIAKEDVFHYVYGVLHDPLYRKKYELNLKREFPHIPFYDDFAKWAMWGAKLMDLHLNYETVEPWPLIRQDNPRVTKPKPRLKADFAGARLIIDSQTTLTGLPPEAEHYVLGNRTALEWVLDRHRERVPKDQTIRERFNTYRFADYKEEVIDLLKRVTTVSVETVRITRAMERVPESERGQPQDADATDSKAPNGVTFTDLFGVSQEEGQGS